MRKGHPSLLCLLLALSGCERRPAAPAAVGTEASGADAEILLIGAVGSLTGSEAHFGLATRDGIQLAVDEENAAGPVHGKRLALRAYDSQSKPEEAAAAATRLVTQDHAVLLLGEAASSNSLAMAPAAAAGQVPMISPSSTSPRVTAEGGPYVFRVCFIDPFQGSVMAKFARGALGLARVAVLTDAKSAYSQGLGRVFTERFTALGGQIVADEAYGKGDTDFRAQLTRIKARRPDGLFIPGYYSDVGPIARQTRELGLSTQIFGGDGWDSADKLAELGGAAIERGLYTTHFAADNPSPRVRAFLERFQARFHEAPDALAALGYDAARVGIAAMRRAGLPRGSALRDALATTRDFDGVTGRITFDAERNPVKSAVIVKIVDGRARFLAEVAP